MAITNFIPAVWSRSILDNLQTSLVYGSPTVVNRDYEGEIAGAGSSVKIHSIGPITVSNYTKNTDMSAPETLSDSEVILTVDQQRSISFQIDDVDRTQANADLMAAATREAAYALAKDVDVYLAGLHAQAGITTGFGSTSTPIVPTATTAYEYLADAFTALDETDAPQMGRFVVVPPWFHGLLRKDARFVSYGTLDNRQTAATGVIGEAAGFTVLKSNNVANTSGAKFKILFGHPSAWSLAMQIEKIEAIRMEKRFADNVKGLNVYGAKVVRPTILGCMTASKS